MLPLTRFEHTYCSQCGTDLGPGDHGASSCCDHGACQAIARGDSCRCDRIPVNEGKAGDEGGKAHSKSEYKRRVALGDTNVAPPDGVMVGDCAKAARCLGEARGESPDTAKVVCTCGVPATDGSHQA